MKNSNQIVGKLVVTFGKKSGKELMLDKDVFTIGKDPGCDLVLDIPTAGAKEVQIDRLANVFVIKVLTDHQITVSGEKILEKILEDGDMITIGNIELKFYSLEGGAGDFVFEKRITPREFILFIIGTGFLIGALLLAGDFFLEEQKNKAKRITDKKIAQEKAEEERTEKKVTLSGNEKVLLIANARKRIQIADSFFSQSKTDSLYYYMAISELKAIINLFAHVSPQPQMVLEANERLAKVDTALRKRIKILKNNAYIAHETGTMEDVKYALERIMIIIPVPTDEDYIWAKKKYLELFIEKGKGKK